jgi:flagellin
MAYTINTNIASLQAQNYLRTTTDFQNKTINRVTSGLRIVNSGDDAAGLAIANGLRSDQAVLTQGVRNATDGLSTLQTIDAGMNNISQLLDRARTLAAQSASGTFTGSRTVLNSEFQSVVGEIDRQAQSIGLDSGGQYAKSLSVFVGGGKTNNGIDAIVNGSVAVDLSQSTVDAKSLGMKGVQAVGVTGTDISSTNGTTSVAKLLVDSNNTGSLATQGFADFYFRGPGFGDANRVKVSVNLSGVTDENTLATAINSAIQSAGNGTTAAATAFKNAGVMASINTDSSGKKQLAFSSSSAAFQVEAGDRMANAFMGNFSAGASGVDLAQTVTAGGATAAGTFAAGTGNIIVRFQGSGLASPVDLTLSVTGGATTVTQAINSLSSQIANNAALQAAGITTGTNFSIGNTLSFSSKRGEQFSVQTVGDTTNQLALGSWMGNGGSNFDYTTITGAAAPTVSQTATLELSVGGGTKTSLSVATGLTLATAQSALNAAITANATASAAGLVATNDGTHLILTSSNGSAFRLNEVAHDYLGFGSTITAAASSGATASTLGATASTFNSGGANSVGPTAFSGIQYGSDDQTMTVTTVDAQGAEKSLAIVLRNDATARNAATIDNAIDTINTQLQQSNDTNLQKVLAVKVNDAGTEKIQFLSTLNNFKVSVGTTGSGAGLAGQGAVGTAAALAGGSVGNISTQDSAKNAVSMLATAVATLGTAQAVVGKGQNSFNYAVSLASSQLTNLAAAESRIRDADLASEAANLTKAQILQQAGIAALAQANSAPQAVLSLLRG